MASTVGVSQDLNVTAAEFQQDSESDDEDDESDSSDSDSEASSSASVRMVTPCGEVIDEIDLEAVLDEHLWSRRRVQQYHFSSLAQFEALFIKSESILQNELASRDYNTFLSFNKFHSDWAASEEKNLAKFLTKYEVSIMEDSLSCVGLSLALIQALRTGLGPELVPYISLVSCEESVKDIGSYSLESPNNLKEHVLVCMAFSLSESGSSTSFSSMARSGYLIWDPGYHVARPVVVMSDGMYPHTGWFNPQVPAAGCNKTKEYCYEMLPLPDSALITWRVRESRPKPGGSEQTKTYSNLIYVGQSFAKCLTIPEKRTYVYSFKSWCFRDRKGLVAGLYSWIESRSITLFWNEMNEDGSHVRKQVKFAAEQIGSKEMTDAIKMLISSLNSDQDKEVELEQRIGMALEKFGHVVTDENFLAQIAIIDKWIEEDD